MKKPPSLKEVWKYGPNPDMNWQEFFTEGTEVVFYSVLGTLIGVLIAKIF